MLGYVYIQMCLKIAQQAFLTSIFIKGDPDRLINCNSSRLKHLLAKEVDRHAPRQLVAFCPSGQFSVNTTLSTLTKSFNENSTNGPLNNDTFNERARDIRPFGNLMLLVAHGLAPCNAH